jgi:hypothetical protein
MGHQEKSRLAFPSRLHLASAINCLLTFFQLDFSAALLLQIRLLPQFHRSRDFMIYYDMQKPRMYIGWEVTINDLQLHRLAWACNQYLCLGKQEKCPLEMPAIQSRLFV